MSTNDERTARKPQERLADLDIDVNALPRFQRAETIIMPDGHYAGLLLFDPDGEPCAVVRLMPLEATMIGGHLVLASAKIQQDHVDMLQRAIDDKESARAGSAH